MNLSDVTPHGVPYWTIVLALAYVAVLSFVGWRISRHPHCERCHRPLYRCDCDDEAGA